LKENSPEVFDPVPTKKRPEERAILSLPKGG
jgi:hypothetical protein